MEHLSGLKFLIEYLKKPRSIGAVLPSSKYLARKMVTGICFERAGCIVEYGPGTGVFTDELINRRSPGTVLLLIEKDPGFFELLAGKYKDVENLTVVSGTAGNVGEYLNLLGFEHADYIVSGLPFASLPQEISSQILLETKKHLHRDGEFITFQYTRFKMGLIKKYFDDISLVWEIRNVPPAYVLRCK